MALNRNGSQSQTPPWVRGGRREREKPRNLDKAFILSWSDYTWPRDLPAAIPLLQASVSPGLQKGLDRTSRFDYQSSLIILRFYNWFSQPAHPDHSKQITLWLWLDAPGIACATTWGHSRPFFWPNLTSFVLHQKPRPMCTIILPRAATTC